MKFLGLGICLGIITGSAVTVGSHLFFDLNSLVFVLGGATGFLVMKNDPEKYVVNFGEGAVYFGWLGTLIGLISITGDRLSAWGDGDKMGPALAVAMLTILYGYSLKLITIALAQDLKPVKE